MCKRIVLMLAMGGLIVTSSGFSQTPPALFIDVNENSLSTSQAAYLKAVKNRKATADYKVVRIASVKDVKNTPNVILDLKPGLSVQAQQSYVEIRSEDDFTWLGKIEESFSQVTLVVNPLGIYGTIWVEGELYRIESLGGDKHAIVEVDKSKFD